MTTREAALALLSLVLLMAFLEGSEVTAQEKTYTQTECQRAHENAERYATLLAAVLNGATLRVGDSVAAVCYQRPPQRKAGL